MISVLAVYSDGQVIEMATIGREGCTGVQAVFGAKSSSARYFAQIPAIHHSDEDIVVRIKADAPVLLPDEPIRPTQFW